MAIAQCLQGAHTIDGAAEGAREGLFVGNGKGGPVKESLVDVGASVSVPHFLAAFLRLRRSFRRCHIRVWGLALLSRLRPPTRHGASSRSSRSRTTNRIREGRIARRRRGRLGGDARRASMRLDCVCRLRGWSVRKVNLVYNPPPSPIRHPQVAAAANRLGRCLFVCVFARLLGPNQGPARVAWPMCAAATLTIETD